jgi:transposase
MRRIHLASHLSVQELAQRYRQAKDPTERSRWHMLWLLARGYTATAIAELTGYSPYWIGRIARRYNAEGAAAVVDKRHLGRGPALVLSAEQQAELRQALAGPPPQGDVWTGRTVAEWLSGTLGRPAPYCLGYAYLRRFGLRPLAPRPRHVQADVQEQEAFKRGSALPSVR